VNENIICLPKIQLHLSLVYDYFPFSVLEKISRNFSEIIRNSHHHSTKSVMNAPCCPLFHMENIFTSKGNSMYFFVINTCCFFMVSGQCRASGSPPNISSFGTKLGFKRVSLLWFCAKALKMNLLTVLTYKESSDIRTSVPG